MRQTNRTKWIVEENEQIPEPVKKLSTDLENLLQSKSDVLAKLFSETEYEQILKIGFELAKAGYVPEWFVGLSGTGGNVAYTLKVELWLSSNDEIESRVIAQKAEEGLRLLSEIKEERSKLAQQASPK